jgi:hypothetical protein
LLRKRFNVVKKKKEITQVWGLSVRKMASCAANCRGEMLPLIAQLQKEKSKVLDITIPEH